LFERLTRTVLDRRFQDSSKAGSGINFFAAFFAAFLPTFLGLLLAHFFEYAAKKSCYFEKAVQKSVAHFWGVGWGGV